MHRAVAADRAARDRARGAGGDGGQHAVDQFLDFDHVGGAAAPAQVSPVVEGASVLDHHRDHRRDRSARDQAIEALLDPDFEERGRVAVAAVQEIQDRVAARGACIARRQIDEERAFAGERRRGEAGAIDRAAGAVMADGDERRQ